MRLIVVGGGIVGLASAYLAASRNADLDVIVLEKERAVGTHQTGHNSGVVHAGLYYEPGSLKARLCRRGGQLLRAFAAEHDIEYDECGKVLVATREDELPRLEGIRQRAAANGVPDVELLDAGGLAAIEPNAAGIAALHSPRSAIVDFGAVARALAEGVRRHGGQVRTGVRVRRVVDGARPSVVCADGSGLACDRVLVCVGLHADRLARASGESAAPRVIPFRGEYWALRPDRRHLVRGLIYPVPDPALPFLGVHLTRRIDASVLVGPNAVLGLAREGYRRRAVHPRDAAEIISWPGTWRLAVRHRRVAVGEVVRSASKRRFTAEAQRLVPAIEPGDLVRAPAGVRAQAVGRDGSLIDDFCVAGHHNVVWVRNAPSPAATSSLAVAEQLVDRLGISAAAPGRSSP